MADSTPPSSSPPTAPSQRPPTPTAPRGIAAAEALSSARQAFFEAQRRYPHDASVFVGNLPAERTDLNLLHCVEDLSRRFGTCEVMINRGKAAIPTAVVQYQLPQEAHKAIMEHGKLEIGDKKLRITRSEAPRAI